MSFKPRQKASSRLTLVLCPPRTIDRLTIGDFMRVSFCKAMHPKSGCPVFVLNRFLGTCGNDVQRQRANVLQSAALQDRRYDANPARQFLPQQFGKTFYALTHSDTSMSTTDAGQRAVHSRTVLNGTPAVASWVNFVCTHIPPPSGRTWLPAADRPIMSFDFADRRAESDSKANYSLQF